MAETKKKYTVLVRIFSMQYDRHFEPGEVIEYVVTPAIKDALEKLVKAKIITPIVVEKAGEGE